MPKLAFVFNFLRLPEIRGYSLVLPSSETSRHRLKKRDKLKKYKDRAADCRRSRLLFKESLKGKLEMVEGNVSPSFLVLAVAKAATVKAV